MRGSGTCPNSPRRSGATALRSSADAESAIRAARKLKPDVVVMDFALPGRTGAEATQEILKTVDTAVLILSMHSEPSYVRAALDYLSVARP